MQRPQTRRGYWKVKAEDPKGILGPTLALSNHEQHAKKIAAALNSFFYPMHEWWEARTDEEMAAFRARGMNVGSFYCHYCRQVGFYPAKIQHAPMCPVPLFDDSAHHRVEDHG